jgi:ABC-2 type transport system ATP-binding protein
MIHVKNVVQYYGKFLALDHIGFEVGEGEVVAFLGPNGAGKTTTMRIITGFITPLEGEATIDGLDLFEEPRKVKSRIGYLPENPPLYPELTVFEFLSFVAELRAVEKGNLKKQVEKAIELTDLKERRNTLIGFLSKGLKQRVGIAQSIVNSPKVLILDEPTVGLDPLQVIDIRNLIKKLSHEEKRTIILSTHLLAEASEICEKAIIIHNGKILVSDSIDNLKREHFSDTVISAQIARNQENIPDLLKGLKGVKSVQMKGNAVTIAAEKDVREEVAKVLVGCGAGILELGMKSSSLEDVFIKLVQ